MDLKKQLIELKAMGKEQIFNLDMDDLIHKMLVNIGTVDPELRDALIYATFIRLIDDDFLTRRQLLAVMETCLDHNHLFYRIGETNSDSVFTRSFSSLIIAAVLEKDKKGSLLPAPLVAKAMASGHSLFAPRKRYKRVRRRERIGAQHRPRDGFIGCGHQPSPLSTGTVQSLPGYRAPLFVQRRCRLHG